MKGNLVGRVEFYTLNGYPGVSPGPDGEDIDVLPFIGHRIQLFLNPVNRAGTFMDSKDDIADFLVILCDGLCRGS